MKPQKFYIERQKDGSLTNDLPYQKFLEAVKKLKPGRWLLSIERYYPQRTLPQNALFHVYFTEIAEYGGTTMLEVKGALKKLFLTVDVKDQEGNIMADPKTGEVLTRVMDTSELNEVQGIEFIENIRIWAMDFGIYLESPDEQAELRFKDLK